MQLILPRYWRLDGRDGSRGARPVAVGIIVAFVGQITDARGELESKWVKQCKDVVGEAGRIGVVLLDSELGFVVEEPVEHMSGVAHIGVDHLGVERRVLVGQMGIEQDARLAAVFGVSVACGFPMAAGAKALPIAG